MPRSAKRAAAKQHYHHGDLRAALIDTAVELIGANGVRGFSLAEASRRLGVTAAAPYRHFADRDELLAAVGIRAGEALTAAVLAECAGSATPIDRLAGATRGYVRFAVAHPALFEAVFGAGIAGRPAMEANSRPVKDVFCAAARQLSGSDRAAAGLALAVAATAHGHAMLARADAFGTGPDASRAAVDRAGEATLALIAGRTELSDFPAGTR